MGCVFMIVKKKRSILILKIIFCVDWNSFHLFFFTKFFYIFYAPYLQKIDILEHVKSSYELL